MENQGLGIRGWGLGILLALAATTTSQGLAKAQLQQTGLTITVWTYNYAHAPQETTARGKVVAGEILRNAGMEIVWMECPLSTRDGRGHPTCHDVLGPLDLSLRILPKVNPLPFRENTLGFAALSGEGDRGSMASIFYQSVQELAVLGDAPEAEILGHAIAHEIGHLLLCTIRHTDSGIMRVAWGRKDLKRIQMEGLHFSVQQGKQMRVEVLARNASAPTRGTASSQTESAAARQ